MAITNISRDWGVDPQIVRMVTTDTIGTIATTGYWATQAANLLAINRGDFEWVSTDIALISYNGGEGFFVYDSTTGSFTPQGSVSAQVTVTSAQILGMYAAPVLIIPSPGTNKLILMNQISGTLIYNTTQYTAGGAIGLQFGSTIHGAGEPASATLAAATFNGYAASNSFQLVVDNSAVLASAVGLGIYLSNATAAFATGDSKLLLNVSYQIVNAA